MGTIEGWSEKEHDCHQKDPGPPPGRGRQQLRAEGVTHARGLAEADLLPRKSPVLFNTKHKARRRLGH